MKPLAIITGVGPGTGAAMARRFHDGGYRVAMIARNAERLGELAKALPDSFAVPCDVSDTASLLAALDGIEQTRRRAQGRDPQRGRRRLRLVPRHFA